MAKYDNSFTDELRARLSLVDVIGRRVPLVKKGQNYWGCCPFHNEKTPSFSVNEEKGFYHCFGCGEHGDIISFTMKAGNMDFRAAIAELADMAGLKLPEYKSKSPEKIASEESYISIYKDAQKIYADALFSESGAGALNYIRGRGFSDDMIKKYGIGYAGKNNVLINKFINIKQDKLIETGLVRRGEYGLYDFFRDKLMFPIFNANGQIVAFSGRSLNGTEPKYINTSDTEMFHKRQTIFGFNFARDSIHRKNRSIIVEGQIDAIQMQCNGFGETVAPLGTALTEDHIAILCKSNRNIIFCFDGDGAGQKAAARACDIVLPFLRDTSDVKFAFVTGGKDPDEVLKTTGQGGMEKIINSAIPLIDFLWKITNDKFIISTPGGRSQAEKFLKSEIDKITDPDFKNEIIQEYNQRKFNQWHNWKKTKSDVKINIPSADNLVKNTLVYIIDKYPQIASQYAEFLSKLGISFDSETITDCNLSEQDAENYIYSLKLDFELKQLQKQKKELLSEIVKTGINTGKIPEIDAKIAEITNAIDNLLYKNE
ncbi:MAG: DNA primase [Proteobacteria bacterium]|nr:DNA primase [Candidatus Enterousia scatequi]